MGIASTLVAYQVADTEGIVVVDNQEYLVDTYYIGHRHKTN